MKHHTIGPPRASSTLRAAISGDTRGRPSAPGCRPFPGAWN